ncbi:hypothetical protein laban61_gp006 [Flavobacterium phage vB_FspS_laban6-1]|uniref:Uncharacterized protein n=1 Tax=Flavobacterium phage vB_FspS_laban6-1 TaxID=2686250 RepID=A0A6B9LA99_9CAUD|nr:hypothetical protein HWC90_gp06 [Flavobacterium phage vB_FspS_laban6-1]QHB38977.1 hypothetical protein laban61_gp006 [Flavobacterium phage vB_FspS_laban6-1]
MDNFKYFKRYLDIIKFIFHVTTFTTPFYEF